MRTKLICSIIFIMSALVSCIQDEPLNPEADILVFNLPNDIALTETVFNQNNISITVRKDVDLTSLVPQVEITPGATITPSPDVPQNFSEPVTYIVTSQSGESIRRYTVQTVTSSIYQYSFENWKRLSSALYETPVEYDESGVEHPLWDSSNKGINIYQQYPSASEYPIRSTTNSYGGRLAAEMVTRVGPGSIFGILNIPIVAGSLFTGTFNLLNAMIDPLTSTQFGQPFDEKPIRFRGHYKYKPGIGNYINPDGDVVPGVSDSCAVYSVFYKVDTDLQSLDGRNILNHPNILAIAMMPGEDRAGSAGEDFVQFDIPFAYREGAEESIDFENNNYKLAIVFSSSFYGDQYEGTPGSHLIVDEVEIITEEN